MNLVHHRFFSRYAVLAVAIAVYTLSLAGCGGSSGGSNGGGSSQPPSSALVVGSASGPIYDELAASYHVRRGKGTESAAGFDVLIYDAKSVTPDEIESLPATVNFLLGGKIVVVLNPTQADRVALEDLTGATALVDSPALALFEVFSQDRMLQAVNMVEFPTSSEEDSGVVLAVPSSDEERGADGGGDANVDDATLRTRAASWRSQYESIYVNARNTVKDLSGISQAKFAAAAADTDGSATMPQTADSNGGNPDLLGFVRPDQNIPLANGSQFLTVQPFVHYFAKLLGLQTIYGQDRFAAIYPKAVKDQMAEERGICGFLPINASFSAPPAPATIAINVETATYRILQQIAGVNSHEVIVRQFARSIPDVSDSTQPTVTESVRFCRAQTDRHTGVRSCGADAGGCNAFTGTYALHSLRGFNAQVYSNFQWDPVSAPMLALDSWLPKAANNVVTVSSSQTYEKIVAWNIQGALSATNTPTGKNIGVTLQGNYGQQEKWAWTKGENMQVADWTMNSPGQPALGTSYDFFASKGPNNLTNLRAAEIPPWSEEYPPLDFSAATLTDLQKNGLVMTTESDWSTKAAGTLLPQGKATLDNTAIINYGEVYGLYTLTHDSTGEVRPYAAVHTYTQHAPIQFDFGAPIMRPPVPATWQVAVELDSNAHNGFFRADGVVTLDEARDIDTELFLGAQLEPSGSSFTPTPSVIRDLPVSLTIRAGETKGTFSARAQRVGSPYNVQFYAFQGQGQQAGFPMTVPVH